MKTALLVQNDLDRETDGELLILLAIEEIVWEYKSFLQVSFGSALATLRVRSENPDCAPSGESEHSELILFVSISLSRSPFSTQSLIYQVSFSVQILIPRLLQEVLLSHSWISTTPPINLEILRSILVSLGRTGANLLLTMFCSHFSFD